MWLPRPVYETLPYAYMAVGAVCIALSFWINVSRWSSLTLGAGIVSVVAGLVLWLRRSDYRKVQSEYNVRSLDD